ncbi:TPA: hypothetical protein KOS69_003548 [Clostridioides difficile]|uniref:Phage protein n=1 Tax=Clostridioides difficile TaxID=1496 RepID=A0AB74QGS1_CLODI|nr:hypothetical protein [Clostridioides difficile]MBY1799550.1 hypothetical protein [Clostridioides difficile]MBY2026512.1 hypothetical protein [Clostridioides difficile]MCA0747211.1 hypothetical protein [Clostridioides difficile]VFD36600.1 Uncharacterised protein [Clostridioides difficile]VHP83173.1 Uncharacterised protein [Clostridioides difficile]
MEIDVLGTKYNIIRGCSEEEEPLTKKYDGFVDDTVKKIVISKMKPSEESLERLDVYEKEVIRHEIIHAFLNESGLKSNSDWARNEEIIDYFAIQFPKMLKVFMQIDVL